MKKKLIIIACIIFSSTTFSQQQFSGRVYYTFSMESFSEKTDGFQLRRNRVESLKK